MIHDTKDTESAGSCSWRARRLSLTTVDVAFDQYWSSRLAGLPFLRRLWLWLFENRSRQAWVAGLSMRYDLNELLLKACRRYAYENLDLRHRLAEHEASRQKRTRSPL